MGTQLGVREPARAHERGESSTLRKIYVALLVVGVLAGAPWALTHALFTDELGVDSNTFATGSVSLSANPASAVVTYATMAPGDKVTAPLQIENDGTLELRYAMTTGIDGDAGLAAELQLRVKIGVTECDNSGFGADGTSLYTGNLDSGAFGDPATGEQAGDRTLASSASEVLCFQVELPIAAGNDHQLKTTTATFTFHAEQTANNP